MGEYYEIKALRKYINSPTEYKDSGVAVLNLKEEKESLDSILTEVDCVDLFERGKPLFSGKGKKTQSKRMIVYQSKLKGGQYSNLKQLTATVVQSLEKLLPLVISSELKSAEIGINYLRSLEGVEPQAVHCDDLYDRSGNYEGACICLIALEDNTLFRVVKKSHLNETLEQLHEEIEVAGKALDQSVFRLMKYQVLVMNPKLLHSGFILDKDVASNTRVLVYFGLPPKGNKAQVMAKPMAPLYDGTNRTKRSKALYSNRVAKKKAHVDNKLANFKGKNKRRKLNHDGHVVTHGAVHA